MASYSEDQGGQQNMPYNDGSGGDEGSLKRSADGDFNGNSKRMRSEDEGDQKTTLRLLIQSKDAGGIIGKAGTNIKRLRSEYNAVVTVPDTNSSERVLTITALKQGALDILAEVIPKIGQMPNGHEIQILVQRSQVGSIIGRAGYKIKEIRENSGANVKVFADCLPNSTERVVTMTGAPETIVKCVENVLNAIIDAPLKGQINLFDPGMSGGGDFYGDGGFGGFGGGMGGGVMRGGGMRGGGRGGPRGGGGRGGMGRGRGGGRGGGGGGFGGGANFRDNSGGFNAGGGNMSSLGGASNQSGQDFSQDLQGGGGFGDSSFQQAGGQMNQWNQGGAAGGGGGNTGDQSASSTQVTIPKDLAGSIIGKGGERIRNIRSRCQASIKIDDPLPGSNDRVITITGNQDQINHAQYLLQESVRNYSGKNF